MYQTSTLRSGVGKYVDVDSDDEIEMNTDDAGNLTAATLETQFWSAIKKVREWSFSAQGEGKCMSSPYLMCDGIRHPVAFALCPAQAEELISVAKKVSKLKL